MKKLVSTSVLLFALVMTGCSSAPESEPVSEPNSERAETTPQSEPEPEMLETFSVGDLLELPTATFVVNTLEQRDIVESSHPDFSPHFVPGEGERLWYFDITWTNLASEAVSKECHGPSKANLQVFDVDGNQMLMVDQPGHIVGQNCTTGLLTGQTGTWLTAFRGLDADFGWAVFSDYEGGEAILTLDPDLKLSKS